MCGYCHPKAEHWYQNYDKQAAPARDRLGVATHTAPREGFWNDIVHIATAAALTQLDAPRESMEAVAPYVNEVTSPLLSVSSAHCMLSMHRPQIL